MSRMGLNWATLLPVERKMRLSAMGLMAFAVGIFLRWLHYGQARFSEFAFTDRILKTGLIEDLTLVTMGQRVTYYALLQGFTVFNLLVLWFAIQFCVHIIRGRYIHVETMMALRRVGIWMSVSIGYSVIFPVFIRPLLSWNNPSGMVGPRLYLNSTELALMAMGVAFVIVGWIMGKAIELAAENEGFV